MYKQERNTLVCALALSPFSLSHTLQCVWNMPLNPLVCLDCAFGKLSLTWRNTRLVAVQLPAWCRDNVDWLRTTT